mgnify:CR=1 FL=1
MFSALVLLLMAGLYSIPKMRAQFFPDIITDNIIGVYPRCSTTCTMQENLFDGNNRPGAAGGAGIA